MTEALQCLRWDAAGEARLRTLTAAQWDELWTLVVAGSGQHLLARRLQRSGIEPPAAIAAALREQAIGIAGRTLQARALLARAIAATGRPALLLKGVDLAERLYGSLGSRPMGDIDVLVRPADAMAYHACLLDQGFTTKAEPSAEMMAGPEHHLLYFSDVPGTMPVELHWRLGQDRFDRAVDHGSIWARAVPVSLAEGACAMAAEDLFLYLCLHLKHHTFETPLTQLWDLAEMLESPAFVLDWEVVWSRAREWNVAEAVRIALHLLTRTLGVPTRHLSDWQPDPILAGQLPDLLPRLGTYPQSAAARDRFATVLSSNSPWHDRLRALRGGLFPKRIEVRANYGRPGDGRWRDLGSYARRWLHLLRVKAGTIRRLNEDGGDLRGQIDRQNALDRHLDSSG